MKKLLSLFIVLSVLFSCSSEEDSPTDSGLTNLQISVQSKSTTSVTLSTTSEGDPNFTTVISYALSGTGNFQQTSSNTISGLEKGTKYDMFFTRTRNGQDYTSPTLSVTTLGFTHTPGNPLFSRDTEVNHLYQVIYEGNTEFGDFAQPLSGYIIIENDSVPLLNVTATSTQIDFEVGKNVRTILPTTADNYQYNYPFEIGLFTNEAYTRITTDTQTNTLTQPRSVFSIDNHVPYIESGVLTGSICSNSGERGIIQPRGRFWLRDQGTSTNSDYNNQDNYNVKITNIVDPTISRTYLASDIFPINTLTGDCTIEGMALVASAVNGRRGFHDANVLTLNLNRNFFIDGDYTIQFIVEDDNTSYFSNEFMVTLD
ncbi:hypothetical protein [Nonlabens sp. Asnod3-H03]|uniref:hypothetical protein n=1 Tax=Nonlabens sp. Asnod3-H03 TaxID=3160580 RepID=UPI0038706B15